MYIGLYKDPPRRGFRCRTATYTIVFWVWKNPWLVERVDLQAAENRLDIWIERMLVKSNGPVQIAGGTCPVEISPKSEPIASGHLPISGPFAYPDSLIFKGKAIIIMVLSHNSQTNKVSPLKQAVILLVSQGIEDIRVFLYQKSKIISFVFLIILFVFPVLWNGNRVLHPTYREDIRSVFAYIKQNWEPGDKMYVYGWAKYAYAFYKKDYGFNDNEVIIGTSRVNQGLMMDFDYFYNDISKIRTFNRVWIALTHLTESDTFNERKFVLTYIKKYGKKLDEYDKCQSLTYLFKF